MAFDAGMMAFSVKEMSASLVGGKVEKIYQPSRDEIIILVKNGPTRRLKISAGASPMIGMTEKNTENPEKAPMFCMLLRKHLSGGRVSGVSQLGFERCMQISFDSYDELGFPTEKHIIAEVMGKYSNIILTDGEGKIIAVLKPVELSDKQLRPILPGMRYELPPAQAKSDPTSYDTDFAAVLAEYSDTTPASRAVCAAFLGISSSNAAELAFRAGGSTDIVLGECRDRLASELSAFRKMIGEGSGTPTLIRYGENGEPKDYSFLDLTYYGEDVKKEHPESFAALFDIFFEERGRAERVHQRASDIERFISNTEARLKKKQALLSSELLSAQDSEKYRLWGDLITANIYRIDRSSDKVLLENYYDEMKPVEIRLDTRLTPQANAQRFYKKYRKSKNAVVQLEKQLELAAQELGYIKSVEDALSRADGEKELAQIREELRDAGYASKIKHNPSAKKKTAPSYLTFRTEGGYTVYCGKNNISNDYIRTHLASKNDWWFHVKDRPGSHVVMITDGDEPSEKDFTEAATVAAVHSSAPKGASVPVDYVKVRELKRPSGAKPGFVIYHTNWTAYVTADEAAAKALEVKKN